MEFESETRPILQFKYLKNQSLSLRDGHQYTIPCVMKEVPNAAGKTDRRTGRSTVVPVFNMGKVFDVPLEDEKLELPDEADFGTKRDYEEEVEQVYAQRRSARKSNDTLRARIYFFARQGVLEIVSDPFEKRRVKKPAGTSTSPIEIAKEMDAARATTTKLAPPRNPNK